MASKFDPSTTSTIYDLMAPQWVLNRDFGEMHLDILRSGTYLERFGGKGNEEGEPDEQYTRRREWSFAMDHCQDLIGLRVDNIFRTPPQRHYENSPFTKQIDAFLIDVDGGGTHMNTFMKKCLTMYYINGCDIVIDKQSSDIAPLNASQEAELGLTSYLHAFGPLERLAWSADHAGRYIWVRYALGEMASPDETVESTGWNQYLTMTQIDWTLYSVPSGTGETVVVNQPHALNTVPVVSFYFKESIRSDLIKVPLSLLTRIAPIAENLLNLVSQIQLDIYHNIVHKVASGVKASQLPTSFAPGVTWAFEDAEAKLEYVQGDTDHIVEKREWANMLIETILRIGKLIGHSGELKTRATSGVQVAVERSELDNEMRMSATQAEAVESEVIRMVISRDVGREVSAEELQYTVDYNKNYVLTGITEIITNIQTLVKSQAHLEVPAPLQVLLRQLMDALSSEDDEIHAAGLAQIEKLIPSNIESSETPEADIDVLQV